jgi:DNA-binding transcriptional MerR regulator
MSTRLSIGDFSRMTHLSVKALRYYHDLGLLAPADVDARTGYRSYDLAQVAAAQIIRRFRDLDMPVEALKALLRAQDAAARNALIAAHLRRMESQLEQTRATVASLRALLEEAPGDIGVEHRSVPALRVAAIAARVAVAQLEPWWSDSFAAISRALRAAGVAPAGPSGGVYATELFTDEEGDATLFVPIAKPFAAAAPIRVVELPAVELAVAVHAGPLRDADRTYGRLGAHVAERAIGGDGPIREHYLVTAEDTTDPSQLRTEIGWPIFRPASQS